MSLDYVSVIFRRDDWEHLIEASAGDDYCPACDRHPSRLTTHGQAGECPICRAILDGWEAEL